MRFAHPLALVLAATAVGGVTLASEDTPGLATPLAAEQKTEVDLCDYGCEQECPACCGQGAGWFDELTFFGGIDGSKQPQDFGVNANLGGQAHVNWSLPLIA